MFSHKARKLQVPIHRFMGCRGIVLLKEGKTWCNCTCESIPTYLVNLLLCSRSLEAELNHMIDRHLALALLPLPFPLCIPSDHQNPSPPFEHDDISSLTQFHSSPTAKPRTIPLSCFSLNSRKTTKQQKINHIITLLTHPQPPSTPPLPSPFASQSPEPKPKGHIHISEKPEHSISRW